MGSSTSQEPNYRRMFFTCQWRFRSAKFWRQRVQILDASIRFLYIPDNLQLKQDTSRLTGSPSFLRNLVFLVGFSGLGFNLQMTKWRLDFKLELPAKITVCFRHQCYERPLGRSAKRSSTKHLGLRLVCLG